MRHSTFEPGRVSVMVVPLLSDHKRTHYARDAFVAPVTMPNRQLLAQGDQRAVTSAAHGTALTIKVATIRVRALRATIVCCDCGGPCLERTAPLGGDGLASRTRSTSRNRARKPSMRWST